MRGKRYAHRNVMFDSKTNAFYFQLSSARSPADFVRPEHRVSDTEFGLSKPSSSQLFHPIHRMHNRPIIIVITHGT